MEKRYVPALRFKGFTDDWEQRKVGELLIERNQPTVKCSEYPLMAFIANKGIVSKGIRYDRSALILDAENKIYKKTEFNDFIYSSNNLESGSIGLNKYGKSCISPVYSIFQVSELADADFIGKRLVRPDFKQKMIKWRQGVIYGQWKIHESDFVKIDILIPSLKEQQKIGEFLEDIDHLITLHQRKHKKLLALKKALLEKMFPKKEEKIPEVRFSGFTDDWEQRKLSTLVGKTYGGGTPNTNNSIYWNGDIPWIQSSNVVEDNLFSTKVRKYISNEGLLNSAAQLVPKDSVAVVTHVGVGKLVYMGFSYTTSQDFISLSELKCKVEFLCYALHKKLNKDLHIVQGSAIKGITKDDLLGKVLIVPVFDEQVSISHVLWNLDRLITLHQRKLEKLQNIKKAMLEKMFA